MFIEGRYHVDHERCEEALACFDRLLAVDVSVLPDAGPAYDERIFGSLSHDSRGVCLFRLGRRADATAAWAGAAQSGADDPSYAAKRHLALARAGTARPA